MNCLVSRHFPPALFRLGAGLILAAALAQTPARDARDTFPPEWDRPPGPGEPPPGFGSPPGFAPGDFGPPIGPPPGFGPWAGPRGFGPGGMNQERKLVAQFDRDGDGRLNQDERQAAREFLRQEGAGRQARGPGFRRGSFGPEDANREPPRPGRRLTPADVPSYPDRPIYDPEVIRTFFLEFENADWEQELADFNNTDVEVPARVTVDGRTYADVGVHFRGATSFMFVPTGRKRSLNLSFDFVHRDQHLGGYRTFNLLNGHQDPSLLLVMLYLEVARAYHPAPKACFVRVVINGECWGLYTSVQQFNKDFIRDHFGATGGARWKVPGSPQTRAGLEYHGEDEAPYRRLYELKTRDTPEVWTALIRFCRVLNQTPVAELPAAIEPLLDVDGALRFLAVENALINNDGYWVRSSDYNLYLDKAGRFHLVPHDINETFTLARGPGFGRMGGPPGQRGPGVGPGRGGGVELDPLVAVNDPAKPLLSRLLAVPEYRTRYLGYVRDIAETWLDWDGKLGALARRYHELIAEDVKADTRKLYSTEAFLRSLEGGSVADASASDAPPRRGFGPGGGGGDKISLREFAQRRRAYLLDHPAIRALPAAGQ